MRQPVWQRWVLGLALGCACGPGSANEAPSPHASQEQAHEKAEAPEKPATAASLPQKASEDDVEVLGANLRTNKYSDLTKAAAGVKFQVALESARGLRRAHELKRAESALVQLLEGRAPDEIKRAALLELGMVMQEQSEPAKAQQLFSEFARRYPADPSLPEVLLRQAYLYRDMGVPVLALSKFYAVISSCLSLKVEQLEYYQKLVLRAQAEIAETYFLDGKFAEAADYFSRLLRLESGELDRAEALYRLARCYTALGRDNEGVATARTFLEKFPDSPDAAEARFLLASGLKKIGRSEDAVREIGQLLKTQLQSAKVDPKQWLYWQQRAGNEIANQFYRDGDFLNALHVYNMLADLNNTPEWQIPVWYQIGLVLENLKQPEKAAAMYAKVVARQTESAEKVPSPSLKQISEMAAWRKQCLNWESSAQAANRELQNPKQDAL